MQEVGYCIAATTLPLIEAVVAEATKAAAIAAHFTRIGAAGSGFVQQLDRRSAFRLAGLEDCLPGFTIATVAMLAFVASTGGRTDSWLAAVTTS